MKLVIFGLTISSSWGNGHATLWRGLCRSLTRRGHQVVFFERDAPYYAAHRDLADPDSCALRLYADWEEIRGEARRTLGDADVGMVTSYCPDGAEASETVLASPARLKVFYDLDTPVSLDHLAANRPVPYFPARGLGDFDLVLSYTGGRALDALRTRLGARTAAPLYGSADPGHHRPVATAEATLCDLSYLGTYAADRQDALERLFVEPARARSERRFVLGGSLYPRDFPWTPNIFYYAHVAPPAHRLFYGSSRVTLNVTRGVMAAQGFCPSGRLFEAAACGVPVLTDSWEGLEAFFEPGREMLVAATTADALAALDCSDAELARVGRGARERVLASHTADHRAIALEQLLDRPGG